jgi:RHS repeat-associated protein
MEELQKPQFPIETGSTAFFVSAIKDKGQAFRIAMTPCGRRLWKGVDGVKSYFLYSDEGLIGEYDSAGNEIKTYGWTPDSIWGTDPLFQKIGSTYYFYQNDHLGTPQKLIGTNGLVVWAGVYDSFGNCQVEVDGITNNLRFAGQYYDQETGLHYNWLRYYNPLTGRYLRTEPFGVGLNLYAYCFNNPHNWIDPLGLCAVRNFLSNPIVNNMLALIGGTAQAFGGALIVGTIGWTGIGGIAGGVLAIQGSATAGVAIGNLANLLIFNTQPAVRNSGLIGGVTSAITDNKTILNMAVATDVIINFAAGGIGTIKANQSILYNPAVSVDKVMIIEKGGETIVTTTYFHNVSNIINSLTLPGVVSTSISSLAE